MQGNYDDFDDDTLEPPLKHQPQFHDFDLDDLEQPVPTQPKPTKVNLTTIQHQAQPMDVPLTVPLSPKNHIHKKNSPIKIRKVSHDINKGHYSDHSLEEQILEEPKIVECSQRVVIQTPPVSVSPPKEAKEEKVEEQKYQMINEQESNMVSHLPDQDEPMDEKQLPFMLSNLNKKQLRTFYLTPLDKNIKMLHCKVIRQKTGFMSKPKYCLTLKQNDFFLLSAKKKSMNKSSNFYISMDYNKPISKGEDFLGKLRSNFSDTHYTMYDDGDNPKHATHQPRHQLGVITYEKNHLGIKGPRKITVGLPTTKMPESENLLGMLQKKDQGLPPLEIFINAQPKWNPIINAYVLNFDNNKFQPSIKNFKLLRHQNKIQLAKEGPCEDTFLIFGKVDKDQFHLQFRHPFTPYQAFCLALTTFDSSLARE